MRLKKKLAISSTSKYNYSNKVFFFFHRSYRYIVLIVDFVYDLNISLPINLHVQFQENSHIALIHNTLLCAFCGLCGSFKNLWVIRCRAQARKQFFIIIIYRSTEIKKKIRNKLQFCV
jgi:hypothetical protein